MSSKPRPRPKPRAAKPSSPPPSSSQSQETAPGSIQTRLDDDDEDAFFMKNKTRTAKDWQKINEAYKESKPVKQRAGSSADEDSDDDIPSPRRKGKKKTKEDNDLPAWTRMTSLPKILSSEDEDDEDDDLVEVIDRTPGKPAGKRKRPRSRSRSITPPPALPAHQLQNARNLVRQALGSAPRAASPTVGDDSTDTIVLDPELERIAQDVRARAHETSGPERESVLDHGGGPSEIKITVRWSPHPLDDAAREKGWVFKMKRHDTLFRLFEETAKAAKIISKELIITHSGKRVFPSATPSGLRMWAEGELGACDVRAYEYKREHRNTTSPPPQRAGRGGSPSSDAPTESEDEGEKFKIIVRSAQTQKDIVLAVRPTTTCGAIVRGFLKKAGLGSSPKKGKSPKLMIDGDRMAPDTVIGTMELEDGDLVEVVDL